jgi:hypothetical protein
MGTLGISTESNSRRAEQVTKYSVFLKSASSKVFALFLFYANYMYITTD